METKRRSCIIAWMVRKCWATPLIFFMKTKRLFLLAKYLVCIFLLFLFASCTTKGEQETGKVLPNIIVIFADDLGWKDVGFHNSEIKTPTLDKMAKEGVVFDRFYVHSVCSPTRASLLTGRMPSRFGIYAPLGDEPAFPKETMTIARLLKQKGYETAISGKWHLGAVPEARPLNYGFDSSYGYLRGQIDPITHLYKNGNKTWHRNDELLDEEGHATDLISKESIRFIEKSREKSKPFFLYIAYSVPHYPLDEAEEWVNEYSETIKNESRQKFAASVTHMDYSIGQVFAALRKTGMDKNTVTLFLSDNGGQKSWYPKTEYGGKFESNDVLGNNLPLRDWKTSLYDGALRVPALLYWPGKVTHKVIKECVNVADIFPTLAYLAGVKASEDMNIEGINFWPAIEGQELPENRIMYWRTNNSFAIKIGDWKLIHHGENFEDGNYELYNTILDPNEENNVAVEHHEKVQELRNEIEHQMAMDKPAKPEASM